MTKYLWVISMSCDYRAHNISNGIKACSGVPPSVFQIPGKQESRAALLFKEAQMELEAIEATIERVWVSSRLHDVDSLESGDYVFEDTSIYQVEAIERSASNKQLTLRLLHPDGSLGTPKKVTVDPKKDHDRWHAIGKEVATTLAEYDTILEKYKAAKSEYEVEQIRHAEMIEALEIFEWGKEQAEQQRDVIDQFNVALQAFHLVRGRRTACVLKEPPDKWMVMEMEVRPGGDGDNFKATGYQDYESLDEAMQVAMAAGSEPNKSDESLFLSEELNEKISSVQGWLEQQMQLQAVR